MTASTEPLDWRRDVTFSQRHDSITRLHEARIARCVGDPNGDPNGNLPSDWAAARAEEQAVFDASRSLDSYLASISSRREVIAKNPHDDTVVSTHDLSSSLIIPDWAQGLPPRTFMPGYQDCVPFAKGVSSFVYFHRPTLTAIKVVEHNSPPPHSAKREIAILEMIQGCKGVIELCGRDLSPDKSQEWDLIVMRYQPLTLETLLEASSLSTGQIRDIFRDVFAGLVACHSRDIIHRDIKPSSILLSSPQGPAYLSDFGTAYHPAVARKFPFSSLSPHEPSDAPGSQILDIGTGPYRCPDVLFGNASYGPELDMWAVGATLAEAARDPPRPLFTSPPTHEDGSQLGLIQSIFQTLGTPTLQTWPEAERFRIQPWDMWKAMEGKHWDVVLEEVEEGWRDIVAALVVYSAGARMTAAQAKCHRMLQKSV